MDGTSEGTQVKYRKGDYYPKYWKNTAMFLPSQTYINTIAKSPAGTTIDSLAQSIKKKGFNYNLGDICALEYNGNTYIIDGHHRALASLSSGKTLIPYFIEHKDDEYAKTYVDKILSLSDYYDWEDGVRGSAKNGGIDDLKEFDITKVFDLEKILNIKIKNDQSDGRE